MASDNPTARFANTYARVDDGRPCEATGPASEAASPGCIALAGGVPFNSGVTTRQGSRLKQPGSYRVCGYLTGSTNNVSLATDDDVVAVRLPTGRATVSVSPPVPTLRQKVSIPVSGFVDVPAFGT